MDALKIGGAGGAITGLLSGMEQQEGESNEEFGQRKARVRDQLKMYNLKDYILKVVMNLMKIII